MKFAKDLQILPRSMMPTLTVPPKRAATYVRMSTEHQQYSTQNQLDVILRYAEQYGMSVVREFDDKGRSGLNLKGRSGLTELLSVIQSGEVDFTELLVYDVSRWGRFQNPDESAHYEYLCLQAGVTVHYCAEQFQNDGTIGSTLIKQLKRSMAGEYSRELSVKVFHGAKRLIELGYKQGGPAGYGLRRMLVDQAGSHKGVLSVGEHKSIQTDRVILVPGPEVEVENVRWMYRAFIDDGMSERQIAETLNARGVQTDLGREWSRGTVHEVLTNEKYIGNNLYNRTSCKLKQRRVQNPKDDWVRSPGAFEPVVAISDFHTAQGIIIARSRKLSNEEMKYTTFGRSRPGDLADEGQEERQAEASGCGRG